MSIGEQVAYLKGLAEGMELGKDKKEGKLLSEIIDILGGVADELEALREEQEALSETLDAVSDDLADMEGMFSDDEDDDENACYAATCPGCQETVYFDEEALEEGEIVCPNCGRKLEFDLLDAPGDEDTPDSPGTPEA
ncbi:MAG: TFIIB-type zinc ribbon-containing protein [Oscillibacter sp.]|nr:TFIIB-type zinc ribbon-containing protein [Oscillibacter sp.]